MTVNLVNENELTNWIKNITWDKAGVQITYSDIQNREFVANHVDNIADMMSHSYIKKHIREYIASEHDAPYLNAVPKNMVLSGPVQAAVDAGIPAKFFDKSKADGLHKIVLKLHKFLHQCACDYIHSQVSHMDSEFKLDLKFLDKELPDIKKAIVLGRWNVKMPQTNKKQFMLNLNNQHE